MQVASKKNTNSLAANRLPITQAFSDVGGLPFLGVAMQFCRELATATHEMITLLLDTASVPASQISHTVAVLARSQVLQYYSRLLIPIKTELHPETIAGFLRVRSCRYLLLCCRHTPEICIQLHKVEVLCMHLSLKYAVLFTCQSLWPAT